MYVNERTELLNWLSPLQPHARHNDVRARRQDGLGEWFLQANEFLRWRDGEGEFGKATLFCSGNPGVGKTFLRWENNHLGRKVIANRIKY